MKKFFILAASVLLLAATSCGSDNKEDEIINGGNENGNYITARFVEPYDVKDASIETVKKYMSKEAGDLWMTQSNIDTKSSTILYSFVDPAHPRKDDDGSSYGSIIYSFTNGKLMSVVGDLPSYKMCCDGFDKSHEFVKKVEGSEGMTEGAIYRTKDGQYNIIVTSLTTAGASFGHYSISFR